MDEYPLPNLPTFESLAAEIRKLRQRVEDLDETIERNAGAPGVLWEMVKTELLGD